MNDSINKSLVFGSQILALLLVMVGTFLQQSQLKSARPPGPGGQVSDLAAGDRYARLWQDPLEGYQTFKLAATSTSGSMAQQALPPVEPLAPPPVESLLERFTRRVRDDRGQSVSRQWVFWNVIDARPTPEAREVRLRSRYAVVSTLAAAGYQPVFDSSLAAMPSMPGDLSRNPAGYMEIFELEETHDGKSMVNRAYVCWIPQAAPTSVENALSQSPDPTQAVATYFANTSLSPLAAPEDRTRIVILNHGSSDQLKKYVSIGENPIPAAAAGKPRHQVVFVRATIPPLRLGNNSPWTQTLQAVATDDRLIQRLSDELKLRIPGLQTGSRKERILIFTESDGAYGHNLARLIEDQMNGIATVEVYSYLKGLDGLANEADNKPAASGSTGKSGMFSPSAPAFSEKSWGTSQYDYLMRLAASLQNDRSGVSPIVAVGVLGSDVYDKLLVLQALHQQLPALTYFTTDLDGVYLNRENLPFTRNLIIASGEGLNPMSPGKSRAGRNAVQWKLPPMRDSYQVALNKVVNGLLAAPVDAEWVPKPAQPSAWEVGTGNLLELPPGGGDLLLKLAAWPPLSPLIFIAGLVNALLILVAASARRTSVDGFRSRLRPAARRFLLGEAILSGSLMVILLGLITASLLPQPRLLRGVSLLMVMLALATLATRCWKLSHGSQRNWRAPLRDPIGVTLATLAGMFALLALASAATHGKFLFEEPLGLVSGTGIWPSVVLRLAAFLVGLMLLAFTSKIFTEQGFEVRRELEGAGDLSLDRVPKSGPMILLALFDSALPPIPKCIKRWFVLDPADTGEAAPAASTQLTAFLRQCFDPDRRVRRIVLMAAIYFVLSTILFKIWQPSVPARGGATFLIEKLSISGGVGLYIIHLCFCVELHFCAYEIINRITAALPENEAPGTAHSVGDRDLRMIAKGVGLLTRVVGFTLLYPLTILSLILLSRLRLFDDWTMTPSLVLTLLFGVVVLVTVSIMILHSSLRCRAKVQRLLTRRLSALEEELGQQRIKNARTEGEKNASGIDVEMKKLSDEIDKLSKYQEGAFAPWYSQPIFVAILATVAVFGSLGVADSVMSLFVG